MAEQEVVVKFRGDIRDLQRRMASIERKATQTADRSADAFERAGQRMRRSFSLVQVAAGAAFAAVSAGIVASIREAANVEEIESKFEAVFRNLSDETREWSETTADAVNRSAISLREYASTLQDTFVPLGFAREEAAALSRQVTELGIDLASFNNQAEPETIDLLTSALVGNHEAVRRFGVVITEATLQQELMNMGIRDGADAATQQERAQARLNIILASTADAQGDAARTADSMTNRYRGFTSEVRDSAVAIGVSFMPAAEDALNFFDDILPKIEAVGVALGDTASAFTNFFEGFDDMFARGERSAAAFELQIAALALESGDARIGQRFARIRQMIDSAVGRDAAAEIFSQTALDDPDMIERFWRGLAGIDQAQADSLANALRESAQRILEAGEGEEVDFSDIFNIGDFVPTDGAGGVTIPVDADTEELTEEVEEATESFDDLANAAKEAGDAIVNGVEGAKDSVTELDGKVELLDESLKDMSAEPIEIEIDETALDRFLKKTLEMEDVFVSSMQRLEDSIVDALMTGRFEIDDFVEYALRQLARLYVQRAIINPIVDAAGGLFGGGGSSPKIGKAATGGPSSGLTLVGEQGPEIVNLGPMANVMTASMTRKALQGQQMGGESGGSVSVSTAFNIDARGAQIGVEEQIAQAIAQATPIIEQRAVNAAYAGLARTQRNRRAS